MIDTGWSAVLPGQGVGLRWSRVVSKGLGERVGSQVAPKTLGSEEECCRVSLASRVRPEGGSARSIAGRFKQQSDTAAVVPTSVLVSSS